MDSKLADNLRYVKAVVLSELANSRSPDNRTQLEIGRRHATERSAVHAVAIEFLAFLQERGKSVVKCTQQDIYDWWADELTTRSIARTFVRWAMQTKTSLKLNSPTVLLKQVCESVLKNEMI